MENTSTRLALSFSAMLLLAACGSKTLEQKGPPPAPPVPVMVYEVKKESAVYFDSYPATVTPLNQVDLKAQVTGYLTGIYFKDGQHVTKGQKLYDMDRQQYQASYDQGVANLNASKANLEKTQKDADRYTELLKQDAIAKQRVDYALADLQSAKMQVAAAQSNVAKLAGDLRFSMIYAPFDGTIGISQAKIGTLVTANQNVLNTISTDDPMTVDIAVDQKDIPRFLKLQQDPGPASDSTFTLAFGDNNIYPATGAISFIDRAVDPQTGTLKIRLVFNNAKGLLKAGMNTNVRVKNNNNASFILAPYKSLVEQMGEYFVFVLADSSKVAQHRVTLGPRINDKIVVKDGLKEGDKVVAEGVQKLKQGTVVTTGAAKTNK